MATPSAITATGAAGGYVRSFNRFELKYVVREEKARAFAAGLEGYTKRDANVAGTGYPVHSVYWDSADLRFFWEKIEGEKVRRKLRFRRYQGSERVFVEIKQRIDRTVQKRRTRLPVGLAQTLFGSGRIDPRLEEQVGDPVVQEALLLTRLHGLKPKMAVAYRREAFLGAFESDLRITFDRRLQYSATALDLRRPFQTGKYLLDPRLVVVEIKFNNNVPLWLTRLTSRHELDVTRMSKYCSAVDRAFFGGRFAQEV